MSLDGHTAPVLSVDMDKSANTVVSSSCDGTIRIWSVETKKQVQILEGCHPVSNDVPLSPTVAGVRFSGDGERLAVPKADTVLVLEKEHGWSSAQTRSVTITGLIQGERVTCVDWAADSRYILAATNKV